MPSIKSISKWSHTEQVDCPVQNSRQRAQHVPLVWVQQSSSPSQDVALRPHCLTSLLTMGTILSIPGEDVNGV